MSRDDDGERGRAEPIDVDFEPAERRYRREAEAAHSHEPAHRGVGGGTALVLAILAAGAGAAGGAVAPRVEPVRVALDKAFPASATAPENLAAAQSPTALSSRVKALEDVVNAPLDSSGTPMTGGDTMARVIALQTGLRNVEGQLSRIPSSDQVAQLVTEVRGLQEQLPAVAQEARDASVAARAAFAVAAASDASSHSGPFEQSYQSLQALLPQDPNVLALEPLSRVGAPTRADLNNRFNGLDIEIIRAATEAQAGAGFWGRIQAMLAQWIVIRRAGEGDTPNGVVERANKRLAADDLAGAISELNKLSGRPRMVAQPWITDAQHRLEIDTRLAAIRTTLSRGA
ncbi:MAG: mitofilin family membrane protein [Terricaulis sp.]